MVHPRSRGEIAWPHVETLAEVGSPPLARGNPALRGRAAGEAPFTPARAGKSLAFTRFGLVALVHPRSRGEIPPLLTREFTLQTCRILEILAWLADVSQSCSPRAASWTCPSEPCRLDPRKPPLDGP